MKQAKKGGQYGKNGEWYAGGQFLPGSERTIKGEFKVDRKKSTGARKVVIEPGVVAIPPTENAKSLYQMVTPVFYYDIETKKLVANDNFNWQGMGWTEEGYNKRVKYAEMWNNGQRWIKE